MSRQLGKLLGKGEPIRATPTNRSAQLDMLKSLLPQTIGDLMKVYPAQGDDKAWVEEFLQKRSKRKVRVVIASMRANSTARDYQRLLRASFAPANPFVSLLSMDNVTLELP